MAAGILRDILEMLGPWQLLEHLDRGDDVVVDGLAFGHRQRAGPDAQILDFVGAEEPGFDTIRIAPDPLTANLPHALHRTLTHGLAADVGGAKKAAIRVD